MKTKTIVLMVIGFILLIIPIIMGVAWVFMHLWNWIAFGVFSLPELNYWKALGLWLLISFIGNALKSGLSSK